MDTKELKGIVIHGVFAMSPIIQIIFKDLYLDAFRGNWDGLSPQIQEGWARLAELLEAAIKSEMWGETTPRNNSLSDVDFEHMMRADGWKGDLANLYWLRLAFDNGIKWAHNNPSL
jgi:hypothetical protein